jgi:hypothetical protein
VISALLAMAPVRAAADGIYVTDDLKHPRDEHYTFKLNAKQIADVEQRRRVTLSREQIRKFNRRYVGKGETFLVLSTRYDSCTCFVPRYALWGTRGEVDIHRAQIDSLDGQETEKEVLVPESDDSASDQEHPQVDLVMDSKGRLFAQNPFAPVSEQDVKATMERYLKAQETGSREVGGFLIDTPPPINEQTDAEIWGLLSRLRDFGRDNCVTAIIQGYEKAVERKEIKRSREESSPDPLKCRRLSCAVCRPVAKDSTRNTTEGDAADVSLIPADVLALESAFRFIRAQPSISTWDKIGYVCENAIEGWKRLKPKVEKIVKASGCPECSGCGGTVPRLDAAVKSLKVACEAEYPEGALEAAKQGLMGVERIKEMFE